MKFPVLLALCLFCTIVVAMPGGWSSVSVDDPVVTRLTAQAVEYHNKVSNSLYYKKLVTVKEAKTQVVAGLNYQITLLIGSTECPKNNADAGECELAANRVPEECTYVYWLKPGSDDGILTSASCKPSQ